jgi:anti-anti-sigma factor
LIIVLPGSGRRDTSWQRSTRPTPSLLVRSAHDLVALDLAALRAAPERAAASAPGTDMIKDAKSSGIGPIQAEYGGTALRITETDSPTGLVLAGEIDEDTYPALVAKLNELAAGVPEIHFDLAGLEYCDLAGLRAIIRLASTSHDGHVKRVVLHDVPWRLQTVLRIVGWDSTPGLVID